MKKLIPMLFTLLLAFVLTVPASASDASDAVKVQVNGQDVAFSGAAPELDNGRTMVPMRAVLEALGAEVSYDAATATVQAKLGGAAITHVIGTDKIDIAGKDALTMDTVSYVRKGSTMVPLRFFSQALGYEVYWDGGARTAVVIDKQAAVDKIDKDFAILNDYQAKRAETLGASGNFSAEMKFSGEAKTTDGTVLPFSMEASGLYGPEAVNAEGTMDLSALAMMEGDDSDMAMFAPMLKELSFKTISSGGVSYVQIPVLNSILRMSGADLPAGNVWLKSSAPAMAAGMDSTVGSMLYAMAAFTDADVPVYIYDDLLEFAEAMKALMGDGTFTKSGEDYVWKLDGDRAGQVAALLGSASADLKITMEMTLKPDGGCTFSSEITMADAATLTVSGTSSNTSAALQGTLQVKDTCDVTFQGDMKIQAGSKAPDTAPPSGEAVVDLDEYAAAPLTDLGVIGGADDPTSIFITSAPKGRK